MKRITKFKSKNLLGETVKQEDTRLQKERIKSILKGEGRFIQGEILNLKVSKPLL